MSSTHSRQQQKSLFVVYPLREEIRSGNCSWLVAILEGKVKLNLADELLTIDCSPSQLLLHFVRTSKIHKKKKSPTRPKRCSLADNNASLRGLLVGSEQGCSQELVGNPLGKPQDDFGSTELPSALRCRRETHKWRSWDCHQAASLQLDAKCHLLWVQVSSTLKSKEHLLLFH